ncbi:MAG: PKD domain-containing protein, partial [Ignavibacteria bacterium]|nr:PKD domain-containing protein [Ignavibacteria bacterium]
TYKVILKVQDNTKLENNTSYDSLSIRVDATPVPVPDFVTAACPGQTVNFSGEKSYDPDGNIVEYTWDFGDGSSEKGKVVNHTYVLPGMYSVLLTVNDGDNVSNSHAEIMKKIQINSAPEVIIGSVPDACIGEPVNISPRKVFDVDNDSLTYTWKLSDGTTHVMKELKHSFTQAGLKTIILEVNDNKKTHCSIGTDTIHIFINTPPVADAGGNRNGFTGGAHDELLFDGSRSHDADGDQLQYLWDFGDGTKASGEKVYHLYSKPGDYSVVLTVSDGRGTKCSSASNTVKVTIKTQK